MGWRGRAGVIEQGKGWWNRTGAQGATDLLAPDALDRHTSLVQSATVLALIGLLFFQRSFFNDGDTGWHLGAGRWILANRQVPTTDPFSFTFAGALWTAHEWLSEIVMVGAFEAAGWVGLVVLFGLAGGLTLGQLAREAFRFLPARWALAAVFLAIGLLFPFVIARPHMLVWPLMAGWALLLVRARDRRVAPPMAAALLMALWANLHASWLFGLAVAALFGLESLIENPRNRPLLRRWLLFGLAATAAALVTPLGPAHVLYPFQVSSMKALAVIGEWRRATPSTDMIFFICLVGLAVLLVRRWRFVPPLRLLLLIGLAVLGVLHARHQMLFTLVGFPIVLRMLRPEQVEAEEVPNARWFWPALAGITALRLVLPYQFTDTGTYPLTLLSKVPAELRARPVFNEYSQGGPLIMLGIKPYIDGRADMYGDDFTFRAMAIIDGDMAKFREDVRRYDLRWVTLQAKDKLVAKLSREPGWKRFVADKNAVIFIRER